MCSIETPEQVQRMEELIEIKRKYELKLREMEERCASMRTVSTICNMDFKESRTIGFGCDLERARQTRDVSLRCNLDAEQRVQCDVSIACHLDKRPEQRDATVAVNTIEPVVKKETRSSATHACLDDPEKTRLSRELDELRLQISRPKPSREVACSMDGHMRIMDNLVRNQSSSMEQIQTWSRMSNTETCATRDSSTGMHRSVELLQISKGCQAIDTEQETYTSELIQQKARLEFERNQYMELNNELKLRIHEWEEKYHAERSKFLAVQECSKCGQSGIHRSTSTSSLCASGGMSASVVATTAKTSTRTTHAGCQFGGDRSLACANSAQAHDECSEGGYVNIDLCIRLERNKFRFLVNFFLQLFFLLL